MKLVKGVFVERINRFVVKVKIKEKGNKEREEFAYLPNPGRLWEILLKGREVLLLPHSKNSHTKYAYTLWACKKNHIWVPLHTHYTNKIVKQLICQEKIPEFKNYKVVKDEPRFENKRFDLLLKGEKNYIALEIKTCTLFGEKGAMFPDAPSKRATEHLLNLASLSQKHKNINGAIFFAIMCPKINFFLPAYHIDFEFTKAFLETYKNINVLAYAFEWSENLATVNSIRKVNIPIEILKKEFNNSGSYLLIMHLQEKTYIPKFSTYFSSGYYVYVGSAQKNLLQRIARHKRKKKTLKWHIDYLLLKAHLQNSIPIVSSQKLECKIAKDLSQICDKVILNFGASDCKCSSHLFYFANPPLQKEEFQNLLIYYRIDRIFNETPT